jgi:hypothetical protein
VVDPVRFGPGLNAHRLVAEQAIEMANELFEAYARNNAMYHKLRAGGEVTEPQARRVFVERVAPRLLEDARQALTRCLALPDDQMPVAQKDEIAEALILDNDLRAKRIVAQNRVRAPKGTRLH